MTYSGAVIVCLTAIFITACTTEPPAAERQAPPSGDRQAGVRQVTLVPGIPSGGTLPRTNPLGSGAETLRDGERLYHWMNCAGCHFGGGGGIGPPLMDDKWIYGGEPAQIYDTIVNGRANGMPAYGGRLAADEIWRIVAYVETLNPDRENNGSDSTTSEDNRREGGSGGR